jgi:molybdopterin synthase catalytic subunit
MHLRLERPVRTTCITVRCRLFARYAELTGVSDITLELPSPATVGDAVRSLRARLPSGNLLPERPLAAVHLEHAFPDTPLLDGDELALLPPIAGGRTS